ncbi:enoyl-CoA hydratase/isomerase family protein [Novosphingobium aerophilum]|uniref:Enoyl-CoA hydratase/isomerase family protein n=1 Tax=Novosphingobium aerophilum TaxID=2839843 RepID=A0A7X1F4T9_9SPHN|nr:enoyl-CoA hydratase/isomerase family protein [Novosphingobium aerophilum]MBC2650412.1 enoyl-CoA hydratase/isomerase family protein [Novosphingobium aerophilum]
MSTPPRLDTILLDRRGRLLVITLNRPDSLNAFNLALHDELVIALDFARDDPDSDVVLLTGSGRAFSAGGDLDHIARNAAEPERFDHEVRIARTIVLTLLDIAKPVICRMNGHAVGLGATLALLCDVIFAAETARIGDPHVQVGLAAGDGGAIVWAQRIGLTRAKEFLLTGELLTAPRAAELGLINHSLPADQLDAAVEAFCERLLAGAQMAIRYTKQLTNLELKRTAELVLDQGLAWESETVRSRDHAEAVAALRDKRPPRFEA